MIGIRSSLDKTYFALTSIDGISSWWTKTEGIANEEGGTFTLIFRDIRMKMEVEELNKLSLVRWRCVAGNALWVDTQLIFFLEYDAEHLQTLLKFKHSQWKEEGNLFKHCCTKWGVFMLSLKDFLEKNEGKPYPNDVKIDHS